ncbi:MAG: hypothetical protein JSW34_05995 [Candidatus Zixiibacteriota bacterium]|nr:MAG: hypothetical protein JSW34_05995 [candidate division Zixibacteria bacterium]
MPQLEMVFPGFREPGGRDRAADIRPKPTRKISDARRAYLRRYYQEHKQQAREYQRRYNLLHKKKVRMDGGTQALREDVRTTFNASDIMRAPTEKSIRILQLILRGERYFTM